MTRASLDWSVLRASRQRASSSPVIRHKALTARRIDASARQGLAHWLSTESIAGADFFDSPRGASGFAGDPVATLGGGRLLVGEAAGGGGGGAAESLAAFAPGAPPSTASARAI